MAKYFGDLIKLGDGFWAWPEVVGKAGDSPVFVPLEEWREHVAKWQKRRKRPL